MIGTGAYEFESVDFVVEAKAHATKNMNYWNRTALEAVDLFSVTDLYIREAVDLFSVTDLYIRFFADPTSRGNALLATDVDLVNSMLQDPAPIADVKASSYLTYYPTVPRCERERCKHAKCRIDQQAPCESRRTNDKRMVSNQ